MISFPGHGAMQKEMIDIFLIPFAQNITFEGARVSISAFIRTLPAIC